MPKTVEQNKKLKEEKKKLILKEAIKLFSQNGYSNTTIEKVAKAAGVSFGSVFSYFKNKESLFNAAVLDPLSDSKKYLMCIDDFEGTPLERVNQAIDKHIYYFSRNGEYLRLLQFVLAQPNRYPALILELDCFLMDFQTSLVKVIKEGQQTKELYTTNPEWIALSYFSFLNGARLTLTVEPDHDIWKLYKMQALRLFAPLQEDM
ncbi:TetR/AcrR family transcriptional regulator [Jeotgalibacillus marinus]|uniref:Helix-turn-helix domain-containing protein n=1 Tax=Jeotgalibacillus marinus TaxID=86667 RepID=A0ABV3Q102_9BACL